MTDGLLFCNFQEDQMDGKWRNEKHCTEGQISESDNEEAHSLCCRWQMAYYFV